MPSVSLAQNRYVHAAAARGEKWAIKWLREQRGRKVPRVERKGKVGRPRMPKSKISNDALWKRAQRADARPANPAMIRHHVDRSYGRRSDKTVYMSRAQHNREHRRAAVTAEVKRRRKARNKTRRIP